MSASRRIRFRRNPGDRAPGEHGIVGNPKGSEAFTAALDHDVEQMAEFQYRFLFENALEDVARFRHRETAREIESAGTEVDDQCSTAGAPGGREERFLTTHRHDKVDLTRDLAAWDNRAAAQIRRGFPRRRRPDRQPLRSRERSSA
jgi:hypothetical protein